MTSVEDNVTTYDYVVIGGGTSGSVAARRLAEGEKHYSVCLLEAGPRFVVFLQTFTSHLNHVFSLIVTKIFIVVICLVEWERLIEPN